MAHRLLTSVLRLLDVFNPNVQYSCLAWSQTLQLMMFLPLSNTIQKQVWTSISGKWNSIRNQGLLFLWFMLEPTWTYSIFYVIQAFGLTALIVENTIFSTRDPKDSRDQLFRTTKNIKNSVLGLLPERQRTPNEDFRPLYCKFIPRL